MLCRLVYKDGSHGAWTSNLAWISECAEFFGAEIEYHQKSLTSYF